MLSEVERKYSEMSTTFYYYLNDDGYCWLVNISGDFRYSDTNKGVDRKKDAYKSAGSSKMTNFHYSGFLFTTYYCCVII